jgi:predicted transcriptional regulator
MAAAKGYKDLEVVRIRKTGTHASLEPKCAEQDRRIIEILEDQIPHTLSELATCTNLPLRVVRAFVQFLAKFELITYDEQKQIVLSHPEFAKLK